MTRDEILKQSTPRPWFSDEEPWKRNPDDCESKVVDGSGETIADTFNRSHKLSEIEESVDDEGQSSHYRETRGEVDCELIVLAVNSYEADQALSKQLVRFARHLPDCKRQTPGLQARGTEPRGCTCGYEAALATAKGRQP